MSLNIQKGAKKKITHQYTGWDKRKYLPVYDMMQKKIAYQYTGWDKRKYLPVYDMMQKKIAYQYTEWCKKIDTRCLTCCF